MKAIIISGATASGKSQLTLDFASKKDVNIINADALQIYQGLPILSAQPSEDDKKIAPHFLYSHFHHSQSCTVVSWLELVKKSIEKTFSQNKIPLIVGGSGMYISKLLDGIAKVPEISLQTKLQARNLYQELGREKFVENLIKIGESGNIKNLDKNRLIRLYEVLLQTKKPLKYWQEMPANFVIDPDIFTHVNLEIDRQKLYQNCNLRFEKIFANGAIDEVQNLVKSGVSDDSQIAKTLGFQEIKDYLENSLEKEKAIAIASQKTRNYAKRQLTWFRNQFKTKEVFYDAKEALKFLQKIT